MAAGDTTAEAQAVQLVVYRSMTGGQRVALAFALAEEARRLSWEGIALRHPELDDRAIGLRLIEMLHGPAVVAAIRQREA